MNKTNFEHALIAVLFQIPFGLAGWLVAWLTGYHLLVPIALSVGCLPGVFFFAGREHAQWEKHITHGGPVGGLPWLAGFGFLAESKDGRMDFVAPTVAVVIVAAVAWLVL